LSKHKPTANKQKLVVKSWTYQNSDRCATSLYVGQQNTQNNRANYHCNTQACIAEKCGIKHARH